MQLLKLWWMQTDLLPESIGAAIAGRLNGTAFQFAMQPTFSRLDRVNLVYNIIPVPELFALPAVDEELNPINGTVLYAAELSGSQHLIRRIESEFSPAAQDLQWQSMLTFFDMYRGNQSYDE